MGKVLSLLLTVVYLVIGVIVALGFIVLSVPARRRAQAMSVESGSPVPT